MNKSSKIIKRNSNKAPKPVGNYPHSVEVNNMLFVSGIGPRNYKDNSIPGNVYDTNKKLIEYDINKQCHAVFENINSILKESKLSWNSIIDVTVFLIDMEKDFKTFNNIYTKYFKNSHACRTTVEVNKLPTDIAIELKCIAVIGGKR